MKRWALFSLLLTLPIAPLGAQDLRGMVDQLFIFGSGGDQLFLAGTADPNNPASVQAHGDHFVPAAVTGNSALISFLSSALGTSVSNLPLSSTSSGRTFKFEGGVPVASSTSPGPVFAERAQTLGRGRVLAGITVNRFNFTSVRGVPLDNIELNFTHVNADFDGCDALFGGDCTLVGIPGLENDFIELNLDLNLDVTATVFVLSYGLLDNVDIGFALPVVTTNLKGSSTAQVVPFGGTSATHFFAGTPERPELSAARSIDGSASGLGDVAARLKMRLGEGDKAAFAVLAEGRFATGDENDFLGAGYTSVRGLGIVSAQFGDFSPHANVGYLYRDSDQQSDAVLATVGFDHLLTDWVAVAVDVVSQLQAGDTELPLPDPLNIDVPFRRTIQPTNIPDQRDDIVDASFGFKFITQAGLTIVTNALAPLNRGGLRPSVAWTIGLEYNF